MKDPGMYNASLFVVWGSRKREYYEATLHLSEHC